MRQLFPSLCLAAVTALFVISGCGDSNEESAASQEPTLANPENTDIPEAIRNLSHPNLRVRTINAFKLGKLGDKAAAALPALEKIANGPDGPDKEAAIVAIERIKNPQADGDG